MSRRTIVVITGTRAEFGLLKPIMHAIEEHRDLELVVLATGTHLLEPERTIDEVASCFVDVRRVEMQRAGESGQIDDARALGRGITNITEQLAAVVPAAVLVLGDRIEAFAGACAASAGGFLLAHVHGGDRAEGVADEAMRHAITKLAHVHLAATPQSAERIIAMGEPPDSVHIVGSPAIDGLTDTPPLEDARYRELGEPEIVMLMHPTGRDAAQEHADACVVIDACQQAGRTLWLHPNRDAGWEGIAQALTERSIEPVRHLPRPEFIGLLRRARVIVGNSSAGLIECAAIGVPCVNVGDRQSGRERTSNVIDVKHANPAALRWAIREALARGVVPNPEHPFGTGDTGPLIADVIDRATRTPPPLRKRNSY